MSEKVVVGTYIDVLGQRGLSELNIRVMYVVPIINVVDRAIYISTRG